MALSAPTRVERLRVLPEPQEQHLLVVEFTSPEGQAWRAIGGGDTHAEAVAFARDGCPAHTTWQPVRWNDLYGD